MKYKNGDVVRLNDGREVCIVTKESGNLYFVCDITDESDVFLISEEDIYMKLI